MSSHHPSLASGFTLGSVSLRSDHDLVSLVRQVRKAGEEFGLPDADVRRVSAAVYELARGATSSPPTTAHVRIADGPCLQVDFRIPLPRATDRAALVARVTQRVADVRATVRNVDVEPRKTSINVHIRVGFPAGPTERFHAWASSPAARSTLDIAQMPEAELRRRFVELEHAFQELQQELQETNRGVMALYAELDAHAEHLRQAEDRMRLLLDSVQDYAICMLRPRGQIATWNAGAERLFGYPADAIIGRSVGCFYPPAERDVGLPAEHLRRAAEDGRFACEGLRVRNGGTMFDAHVVLTPVRAGPDGELRGFSLVVRDVTERTRLERDLRRRADDLAAANRAKEHFLATLSHELRTPLNAMLGWTRLLRTGKLDEAGMARALETIERNAQIQEQLIADILDLSRIVTGKLRLELRPIGLAPVIHAAVDAVRPGADAKGIDLACPGHFDTTVLGDPDRLQQVVWNLLVNAIKFTPPGGRIEVRGTRAGPQAVVTVADTGEGIAPDLLPFIFDRFTQGDPSVTRSHGGLGLGLSIVRHIVELHGGRVEADSSGIGCGASFSVYLPVRAVHRLPAEQPGASAPPLSGLKVLVVDDDADAREVVTTALTQCGAQTEAVASAGDALQKLPEFRPDVLVSDIAMPGEDGCSLIRRVRAIDDGGLGAVPAVALTAYSQPDDRRRALKAGFQSFVSKPVEIHELARVVGRLAAAHRQG